MQCPSQNLSIGILHLVYGFTVDVFQNMAFPHESERVKIELDRNGTGEQVLC